MHSLAFRNERRRPLRTMILLIGLLTMLAFVARAADPRGPEGLDVRKGTAVPLAEARP